MLVLLFSISSQIYWAVYPDDDFYKNYFEQNTGLQFPASGKILAKDSDYPDQHGKYSPVAVIRFSPADYQYLISTVKNDSAFKPRKKIGFSSAYDKITEGIKKDDIAGMFQKNKLLIAFLKDNERVIIEKHLHDYE